MTWSESLLHRSWSSYSRASSLPIARQLKIKTSPFFCLKYSHLVRTLTPKLHYFTLWKELMFTCFYRTHSFDFVLTERYCLPRVVLRIIVSRNCHLTTEITILEIILLTLRCKIKLRNFTNYLLFVTPSGTTCLTYPHLPRFSGLKLIRWECC